MTTNATWSDGRSIGTFSFYGVYKPLIEHIALDIHLWNCNLGNDDSLPTHALLCDAFGGSRSDHRSEQKMYLGEYEEIEKFLSSQHPPLPKRKPTLEEWLKIKQAIADKFWQKRDSDWQNVGMFEFFGHTSPVTQQKRLKLVQWLDEQVTSDLVQQYIEKARIGNPKAVHQLMNLLRARIKADDQS